MNTLLLLSIAKKSTQLPNEKLPTFVRNLFFFLVRRRFVEKRMKDVRSARQEIPQASRPGCSIRRYPLASLLPANWYRGKPEDKGSLEFRGWFCGFAFYYYL
jgi:hypothetical protein